MHQEREVEPHTAGREVHATPLTKGGTRGVDVKGPLRVLVCPITYNEGVKLGRTLARFPPKEDRDYEVMVVDDGSTDGSIERIDRTQFDVLRLGRTIGVGAGIRAAIREARSRGYDVIVLMAANDKDRPDEIGRLLAPIYEEGFVMVCGSRYLPGGNYGNMPMYRQIATRFVHPWMMSLVVGRRLTDTTNGFRAIHLSLFDDPRIAIDQSWLDQYELEPYLLHRAIRLGYKCAEVPVTKIYPPRKLGYTKMKPIIGWWSMMRPIVYLALGIKK